MPPASAGGAGVDLRGAFRAAASSVWVVTSAHEQIPAGFTAISIASVSLAPALISFNIGRGSSSLPVLRASGRFAAHLLASDQGELGQRFAADARRRFRPPTQWAWDDDGLPLLTGVVTRLTGTVTTLIEAGDSLLAVAAVHRVTAAGGIPLVHHNRAFVPLPSAVA